MKKERVFLRCGLWALLFFALSVPGGEPPPQGRWQCTALDARTLALTGDYGELQDALFLRRINVRSRFASRQPKKGWAAESKFHTAGTEAIAQYRPAVAEMFAGQPKIGLVSASGKPLAAVRTGRWMTPIGEARFRDLDGQVKISHNADVAHYCYLQLDRPLERGEKIAITMPAGEKIDFIYDDTVPTPIFKIDQVGYLPDVRKYAYLGAWLGTAGPMPLHKQLADKPFSLKDDGGRTVFTGKLKPRRKDPVNANGTPFTGEEVLELDFSAFTRPGRYHLEVEGVGRSETFRIGDDTMAEAFYVHARGLYHQRCGIAREKPYTEWTAPACHLSCIRGTFPPNDGHYVKGPDSRPWGFYTATNKSLSINHFLLIAQNVPALRKELAVPGGWHDAADWDRRPQHLGIVGDLAAVYLMKPENFCDGQLNLPESGNGIPDILDEAIWGIEHLRQKQQPDGGVGTWIETTRHPTPKDGGAWDDKLPYYLSCATRNSTLEYAAYASELALALRRAGAQDRSVQFRMSAAKAWKFATDPTPPRVRTYHYNGRTVFYREEPNPAPELLVKTGLNLYLLTRETPYLLAAEKAADAAETAMRKDSWRWSPFFWAELEFAKYESAILDKLREKRRQDLLRDAETLISQQEENYPVRIAWYGPDEAWVHTMSWGTYHPLRRARTLVMAHAMTKDRKFFDAACLANNFHNGANPSGSSMTSGLGKTYPVRFLHLDSYADGIAEFVPGITPYRNTYGLPKGAVKLGYGLFYPARLRQGFIGLDLSLLPEKGLPEKACAQAVGKLLPIWRRWCNVEGETVAASEFTVWETIAPAAAVTGYLLNKAQKPAPEWLARKPVDDIRTLPGYAPLP